MVWLLWGSTIAMSGSLWAQTPPPRAADWVMERETQDRWIHARQQPRFTPFSSRLEWIQVDSIRAQPDGRALFITVARTAYGRDSATIVHDLGGRLRRLETGLAPHRVLTVAWPGDAERFAAMRRMPDGRLSLPASRVWDLVPTFPAVPRRGAGWRDTIARVASDPPYRQSLTGSRFSRIVGDTVLDGRRWWVVRDSASVRYEERYVEHERTLDTLVAISREGSGVTRGVHLYDPELRLFRRRSDTTMLAGTAVLEYPDGRSFRTPARFEQTRTWRLHDAAQYAARRDSLRAQMASRRGGMVGPREPGASRPDPAQSDSARITNGDTAFLYSRLARQAYPGPADTGDVRAMLAFMNDPGLMWDFNLSRDWLYENLAQGLTTWPRAALTGPSERVACTVAGCELLAAQWNDAAVREPRLHDVGLIARYSMDPRRWADTVLTLGSRGGRPLLRRAVLLARGVGADWAAGSQKEMPPAGSDWRTWLEWMNGRNQEARARDAELARQYAWARDTVTRPRFGESHRTALRMYALQTGRDLLGELRRGYSDATSDTARLVFGTMLRGMGALELTDQQMVDDFRSGDPARAALARQVLLARFGRDAKPLDTATAIPIVNRLLEVLADSGALWRLVPDLERGRVPRRPTLHARPGRVLFSDSGLPREIRDAWSGRIQIADQAALRTLDTREAAVVYSLTHPVGWGPFAMIRVSASERIGRTAGDAPEHYAAATTYYLMRVDGAWVVVAWEGWVT
jgi:hypothetical protein